MLCVAMPPTPAASGTQAGPFYRALVRPILFRLDPERVHQGALHACTMGARVPGVPALCRRLYGFTHPSLRQTLAGVTFDHPVGLSAGFDKNGHAIGLLGSLGFSHVEIGSISAFPSAGNPRPRLFRVPADRAIIVAYGVPNEGADVVAATLRREHCRVPLGINLVKTNDPARPNTDEAVLADYADAFATLQSLGSYVTINLSCPNSACDRDFFDDPSRVAALLDRLASVGPRVPVFLKLKPARDPEVMSAIVRIADAHPFIAGFGINLPSGKPDGLTFTSPREVWASLPGAVAGRPVEALINAQLRQLYTLIGPRSRYVLIAAGGVFTAEDAYRKIRLGASLVQLYTAMVYHGPAVVKAILTGLVDLLHRDGYRHVSEAVGADHRAAPPRPPRPAASASLV